MKLNGSMTLSPKKLQEIIQKYIIENNKNLEQTPVVVSLDPIVVEEEMDLGLNHGYGTVSEFQGIKVSFEVESDIVEG